MINVLNDAIFYLVINILVHFAVKFYYKFHKKALTQADKKYNKSWLSVSELIGFSVAFIILVLGLNFFKG
jgi:hypothetical protein